MGIIASAFLSASFQFTPNSFKGLLRTNFIIIQAESAGAGMHKKATMIEEVDEP